jgi:replication factor A1
VQTKDTLYDLVKDIVNRDKFEELLKKEIETYGQLIDDIAAAFLVVDKLGRNVIELKKIDEIEMPMEVSLYVRIEEIGTIKKAGKGKVVNILVADDTGSCFLVLWDGDTDFVVSKKIKRGCTIKIINGYAKEGYYGLEINVGKWSAVKVNLENAPNLQTRQWKKLNEFKKGIAHIKGKIIHINPTKIFFTDHGERFVATIIMADESGQRDLVIWNERVKEIQNIKVGEHIKILKAYIKNGVIHIGEISKILPETHTNL